MALPIITIIGSLNMDQVTYTPRMPRGGETLTATSFSTALGGKGANQAVACAKLSRPRTSPQSGSVIVKMIGAVGSDASGSAMTSGMSAFGVDCSGVFVREGLNTGVAIIIVEEDTGENRILLSPEANHSLLPEHFATLPVPLPKLLIMQLEIPLPTVLKILETANAQGVPVLLNPAPAQKIPDSHYRYISHLVVNESEAALLAGCDESVLDTREGLAKVAQGFRDLGAKIVLITLGARGAYFQGEDGVDGQVPAERAKVVDTTAAGDTFVGAYALQAVGDDFKLEKAVRFANRAAAKTVERKGAQESIPWSDELDP